MACAYWSAVMQQGALAGRQQPQQRRLGTVPHVSRREGASSAGPNRGRTVPAFCVQATAVATNPLHGQEPPQACTNSRGKEDAEARGSGSGAREPTLQLPVTPGAVATPPASEAAAAATVTITGAAAAAAAAAAVHGLGEYRGDDAPLQLLQRGVLDAACAPVASAIAAATAGRPPSDAALATPSYFACPAPAPAPEERYAEPERTGTLSPSPGTDAPRALPPYTRYHPSLDSLAPSVRPAPRSYEPFLRHHVTHVKLQGVEPSMIQPGYQQRLRELIHARTGRWLSHVYVRAGCIELVLDCEEWGSGVLSLTRGSPAASWSHCDSCGGGEAPGSSGEGQTEAQGQAQDGAGACVGADVGLGCGGSAGVGGEAGECTCRGSAAGLVRGCCAARPPRVPADMSSRLSCCTDSSGSSGGGGSFKDGAAAAGQQCCAEHGGGGPGSRRGEAQAPGCGGGRPQPRTLKPPRAPQCAANPTARHLSASTDQPGSSETRPDSGPEAGYAAATHPDTSAGETGRPTHPPLREPFECSANGLGAWEVVHALQLQRQRQPGGGETGGCSSGGVGVGAGNPHATAVAAMSPSLLEGRAAAEASAAAGMALCWALCDGEGERASAGGFGAGTGPGGPLPGSGPALNAARGSGDGDGSDGSGMHVHSSASAASLLIEGQATTRPLCGSTTGAALGLPRIASLEPRVLLAAPTHPSPHQPPPPPPTSATAAAAAAAAGHAYGSGSGTAAGASRSGRGEGQGAAVDDGGQGPSLTLKAVVRCSPQLLSGGSLELLVRSEGRYLPARVTATATASSTASAPPHPQPHGGDDAAAAAGGDTDGRLSFTIELPLAALSAPLCPGIVLVDLRLRDVPVHAAPVVVVRDPHMAAELRGALAGPGALAGAGAGAGGRLLSDDDRDSLLMDLGTWGFHAATVAARRAREAAAAPLRSPQLQPRRQAGRAAGPAAADAGCTAAPSGQGVDCNGGGDEGGVDRLGLLGLHLLRYSLAAGWWRSAASLAADLAAIGVQEGAAVLRAAVEAADAPATAATATAEAAPAPAAAVAGSAAGGAAAGCSSTRVVNSGVPPAPVGAEGLRAAAPAAAVPPVMATAAVIVSAVRSTETCAAAAMERRLKPSRSREVAVGALARGSHGAPPPGGPASTAAVIAGGSALRHRRSSVVGPALGSQAAADWAAHGALLARCGGGGGSSSSCSAGGRGVTAAEAVEAEAVEAEAELSSPPPLGVWGALRVVLGLVRVSPAEAEAEEAAYQVFAAPRMAAHGYICTVLDLLSLSTLLVHTSWREPGEARGRGWVTLLACWVGPLELAASLVHRRRGGGGGGGGGGGAAGRDWDWPRFHEVYKLLRYMSYLLSKFLCALGPWAAVSPGLDRGVAGGAGILRLVVLEGLVHPASCLMSMRVLSFLTPLRAVANFMVISKADERLRGGRMDRGGAACWCWCLAAAISAAEWVVSAALHVHLRLSYCRWEADRRRLRAALLHERCGGLGGEGGQGERQRTTAVS
ncbi:hypothetical protein PLESTF_000321200 [Pleodorina starrii]|nr:hypothetical protein PLESTF_000321200 [Pleodorina starrii]